MNLTPPDGIYPGVPEDDYRAWGALSASTLVHLRGKVPAQARYDIDHPKEQTPEMTFGTLVHAALLEPETILDRFIVQPRFNRTYKDAIKAWAAGFDGGKFEAEAFEAELAASGKKCLPAADLEALNGMVDSAYADPLVRSYLTGPRETELSAVSTEPIYGTVCKIRIDLLVPGVAMVDIKTCRSADPKIFSGSIESHSYHVRAAFYQRIFCALRPAEIPWVWLVGDKQPPYLWGVYPIDPVDLAVGHQEVERLLALHDECTRTGHWPGYTANGPQVVSRPHWARTRDQFANDDDNNR